MTKPGRIGTDLTTGSITGTLVRYALPLLFTGIIQQLYNTVDMIIIGQYVGTVGTVGVNTGGDLNSLFAHLAAAFGGAGQVYISQLVGAGKKNEIPRIIGTLLSAVLLIAAVLTAGIVLFAGRILLLLNCPAEAYGQAYSYMITTALGTVFVFEYNAISGVLRGMGDSKRPLVFITAAAVSNVLMDFVFVVFLPLEAAGAAIATVIAQFFSFAAAGVFLFRQREYFGFDFRPRSFRISGRHLAVIMRLGIPAVCRQLCLSGSQLICSAQINSYGLVYSGVNGIGKKTWRVINIFNDSIDQSAGTVIGQCIGAKKADRARETVLAAIKLCACFGALQIVMALFTPRLLFRIFSNDPTILEIGVSFLRISIIKFLIMIVQGPSQALVTGTGNAPLNFIAGFLDGVVCRLLFSFVLAYSFHLGFFGFVAGDALAHLGAAVPCMIYFISGKWRSRSLIEIEEQL